MTRNETWLPYQVGGLLYAPAIHPDLADKLADNAYPFLTALALCLEDSIQSEAVEEAEGALCATLAAIRARRSERLPLLFVRVRNPAHLLHLHARLHEEEDMLCGYILPKFDGSNAADYVAACKTINAGRETPLYVMPTLESRVVADIGTRAAELLDIRQHLDSVREYVLNVRVGGNDFCQLYGIRRSATQSIYDIGVIRDILVNILNVFGADYVVSGPVWECFGDEPNGLWAAGLRSELALDRLNGFVGKTAIHPSQLPLIYESLQVTRADYDDALGILNWTPKLLGVAKSTDRSRMNEKSCHTKWAERVLALGQIYGIREERRQRPLVSPMLWEFPG